MAIEQQVMEQEQQAPVEQEAPTDSQLSPEEEDDLAIAVSLAQNMIDDGGVQVIQEAMQGSNAPGQVIGDFLMQLAAQMSEGMPQEASLSPRVFLAEGGWVEQISDYLQEQYDVPQDVMDEAEIYIGTQSMSMANGAVQEQPPQPAAPAPQPGLEGAML